MEEDLKITAYIDLLAMSSFVRENVRDAISIFEGYDFIMRTKIIDEKIQPASSEKDVNLKELLDRTGTSSFDYFLPFSDSIFLASSDTDKFIKQLGNFVLSCYLYNSEGYNKGALNPCMPYTSKVLGLDGKEYTQNIYPILFRGGISIGSIVEKQLIGKNKGNIQPFPVLIGEPVVKAVKMESLVKGPRLIIDENSYNRLSDSTKKYIRKTEVSSYYEIMWPAYYFIESNGHTEITKFKDLFTPAINLWYAFNHTSNSIHYFTLLNLIIASTLKFADNIGQKEKATKYIESLIKDFGLESKKELLLKF